MYHVWQGNGWGSGPLSFGYPWGGIVMGLVLLGVIIATVYLVVRSSRSSSKSSQGGHYADPRERGLAILTERFARGEIDSETFRSMKAELSAID